MGHIQSGGKNGEQETKSVAKAVSEVNMMNIVYRKPGNCVHWAKLCFEALVIDFTIKWAFIAITLPFSKAAGFSAHFLVSWNMMNNIWTGKALKLPFKLEMHIKAMHCGFRKQFESFS